MTRTEFGPILAYLGAACGKSVSVEQAEVYFDLLGDLPVAALRAAARLAVLESQYPTLPPPGTLRQLALEALAVETVPAPAEALVLVTRVLRAPGYQLTAALKALPEPVRHAAEAFGWSRLRESTNWTATAAQFRDFYAALAGRARRERLLPAPLRQQLADLAGAGPGPRLLGGPGANDEGDR